MNNSCEICWITKHNTRKIILINLTLYNFSGFFLVTQSKIFKFYLGSPQQWGGFYFMDLFYVGDFPPIITLENIKFLIVRSFQFCKFYLDMSLSPPLDWLQSLHSNIPASPARAWRGLLQTEYWTFTLQQEKYLSARICSKIGRQ